MCCLHIQDVDERKKGYITSQNKEEQSKLIGDNIKKTFCKNNVGRNIFELSMKSFFRKCIHMFRTVKAVFLFAANAKCEDKLSRHQPI